MPPLRCCQIFNLEDASIIDREILITGLDLNINFQRGLYALVPKKSSLQWYDLQRPVKIVSLIWEPAGERVLIRVLLSAM